ncbi:MAG: hypothetical protein HYT75_01010 [Deltaproteobacteria bacterium]|nr:hypothetical protein [Deltaproteobacteria bacterium]MBI2341132.1 hypothetical protein [Deltaproteobacteria bacterium]
MKIKIILLSVFLALPGLAKAELIKGDILAGVGAGFTIHGGAFDGQAAGEYYYKNNISFLMNFDTFANSSGAVFNFQPAARYHFNIKEAPKLTPFLGIGLGAFVNNHGNGGLSIAAPDFGLDYNVARNVYLYSNIDFLHLTDFDGYEWTFKWTVAGVKFKF